MKQLVSFEDSKNLDKAMLVEPYNMSGSELMESASRGIVSAMLEVLRELQNKDIHILILAGNGNNGMDALTIARYFLFAGYTNLSVLVHNKIFMQAESKISQVRGICKAIFTFENTSPADLKGFSLIVDGLLGTGADRPIENFNFIDMLLKYNPEAQVVSIDIPSGIFEAAVSPIAGNSFGNIVPADHTFSILPLKYQCFLPGFRKYCGIIHEIPLVFPLEEVASVTAEKNRVQLLEHDDLIKFVPALRPTVHKYERGSVLIYSGSIGSTGAPLLAAKSSISSGAGLVTLRVPEQVYTLIAGALTGIIIEPDTVSNKRNFNAALCGPGWEVHDSNKNILQELWAGGLPLVVDASALHLITSDFLEDTPTSSEKKIVCTPHIGEMSKMLVTLDMAQTYEDALRMVSYETGRIAGKLAKRLGAVVLVKAACTWIASPSGNMYVYDGCEPGLAVGGSGDVLAGIVVSLLSRGASAEQAACAAVLAHGMAGKKLASDSGFFDASELIDKLSLLMYGASV